MPTNESVWQRRVPWRSRLLSFRISAVVTLVAWEVSFPEQWVQDRNRPFRSKYYFLPGQLESRREVVCLCVIPWLPTLKLPPLLPELMRCHLGATGLKCVCLCVSGWVGEGLSLCALFCVGYSVEKSPHSLSLFCWWTTLAKRAEGQTAEITTAPKACDSRPRPFCLDNSNQHRKPWKWTGSWKWPSVGMIRHFKLLSETFFFSDYDVEGNCS